MSTIVHISGTPASGKSTLGERIKNHYESIGIDSNEVEVFDTDEFITHHNEAGMELLAMEKNPAVNKKSYNARWLYLLETAINQKIQESKKRCVKVLILVGILNNYSWEGEYYMTNVASFNIFLNIDTIELLKRYYARVFNTGLSNDNYWKNVENGIYRIDSSSTVIKNAEIDLKLHEKNGYTTMSPDVAYHRVLDFISSLRR